MLLTDVADRDEDAAGDLDSVAELTLRLEDALRVVSYRPMTKVAKLLFSCIEPVVDRHVIFRDTAEFPSAGLGVVIGVHQSVSVVVS